METKFMNCKQTIIALLLLFIVFNPGCDNVTSSNTYGISDKKFEDLNISLEFDFETSKTIEQNELEKIIALYSHTAYDTSYIGKFLNSDVMNVKIKGASEGAFNYTLPNIMANQLKSKSTKLIICHIPPGNPDNAHTIEISENAWPAHRDNHGDYLGACDGDDSSDYDGDGVNNSTDDFPYDSTLAYKSYYPGEGQMATLLFEDMWPQKGDYDFNDFVVNYNIQYNKTPNGDIKEIEYSYKVDAIGGTKESSFFIRLFNNGSPLNSAQIESVSGNDISHGFASTNANGSESGTSEAVIPIIDNTRNAFAGYDSNDLINVLDSQTYVTADTDTVKIVLTSAFTTLQIDPFIVTDFDRSVEIHLTNYGPTSKANQSLFGSNDDATNIGNDFYYKTSNGYPWGLNVAEEIAYPKENYDFAQTYINFGNWAENLGNVSTDWYVQIESNYVQSRLFQKE